MIRTMLSLMLAVAFAFQGMTGCAMANSGAIAAKAGHCAETAANRSDGAVNHSMPDRDVSHDCKHNCHLPALAAPPALVAGSVAAPAIVASSSLAARHGDQTPPAIPPPRSA